MTQLLKPHKFNDEFIVVPDTHHGHGMYARYGVRVYHVDSRITCHCQMYNSQHKNKQAAIEEILKEIEK